MVGRGSDCRSEQKFCGRDHGSRIMDRRCLRERELSTPSDGWDLAQSGYHRDLDRYCYLVINVTKMECTVEFLL